MASSNPLLSLEDDNGDTKSSRQATNAAVGERVRARAADLAISQSELVRLTGIDRQAVSAYWNGQKMPSPANLFPLANALQCNAEWLATGAGAKAGLTFNQAVVMLPVYDLSEFTAEGKPEPTEMLPVPRSFLGRSGSVKGLWITAMPATDIKGIAEEGAPILCRDVTQRVDAGPHLFFYNGVPLVRSWRESFTDWQEGIKQRDAENGQRATVISDDIEGMHIVARIVGAIGLR